LTSVKARPRHRLENAQTTQEADMDTIHLDEHARRLLEEYGPRAMVVAAQRARAAEGAGDLKKAQAWRRVEAAVSGMRGAPES
jgi:hypothetical protein